MHACAPVWVCIRACTLSVHSLVCAGSRRKSSEPDRRWEDHRQRVSDLTEIRGRVSQNTRAPVGRGNGCWAVPDPRSESVGPARNETWLMETLQPDPWSVESRERRGGVQVGVQEGQGRRNRTCAEWGEADLGLEVVVQGVRADVCLRGFICGTYRMPQPRWDKEKAEVMFVWKCVFEECRARVPGVSGPLQLRMQFIFFDTEGKKTQKERTEAQSKEGLSRRNMAARYMRYITGDCKTPSL